MRGLQERRRTHVNGACNAPTGRKFAEIRNFAVDPERQRIWSIHILFNDRCPVYRKVACQLKLHTRIINRDIGRHDEWVSVTLFPKTVNDGCHQPQDAPCTLELHQCGPVGVESVEDLRMNGVGRFDTLFIVRVVAIRRKFRLLCSVKVCKGTCYNIAILELGRIGKRFKEPPPHNFKAFLSACGRHEDSTRPTTFLNLSSASLPR